MSTEAELAKLTEFVRTAIPIFEHMGVTVVDARPGYAAAEIPAEANVNHFGVIYAGSLFTVAEMLGGVLGFQTFDLEGFIPLVKKMEIKFLRPGTSRVRASASLTPEEIERIETEARANGKAEFTLTATVTDEAGTVVAETEGLYQMRKFG